MAENDASQTESSRQLLCGECDPRCEMTKDDDGQGEKWHKQEFVEENKDHGEDRRNDAACRADYRNERLPGDRKCDEI